MKQVDLSLTPEEALGSEVIRGPEDLLRLQEKAQRLANISYPFIDVWSFQAALSFMAFDATGSSCSPERLTEEELENLGITEEMLLNAIEEAGGAINRSGHYPISEEIREKLEANPEALSCQDQADKGLCGECIEPCDIRDKTPVHEAVAIFSELERIKNATGEYLVTLSISYIVDASDEKEAISEARRLLQSQMDTQDSMCLLTAEDFETKVENAVIEGAAQKVVSNSELIESLSTLVKRIEETPFDRNEGMKGPMIAEAKALLERCNR